MMITILILNTLNVDDDQDQDEDQDHHEDLDRRYSSRFPRDKAIKNLRSSQIRLKICLKRDNYDIIKKDWK